MGHALNETIQDTCIRRARMQGRPTRWVLGTDHAGIATQTKVDKALAEKGISRLEIGREAFVEACYDWYKEYGATIVNQIKGMGCSCDYEDEHFTMEPAYVRAVRQVFADWYHAGLVYKGKRIVNWCPHCTTAIADDEAEYVDEAGHLWYLRYPLTEPTGGMDYLVVATTRPETMLGDTGVAVNPKDERFAHLVGKTVQLPLVDREIPIFADYYVDSSFGTGCVKVTPSHDPNDWAMGERSGASARERVRRDGARGGGLREVLRHGPRRGARGRGGRVRGVGAARPRGGPRPLRHDVLPLPHQAGALGVRAVVRGRGRPEEGRGARGGGRLHPVPSVPLVAGVSGLARQPEGLVHLAPAVVGPPHPHVLLRRVRLGRRQRGGRRDVPGVRCARASRRGRAGHLVQLAAVALRHARLGAGGHGRARDAHVLSHPGAVHRARHHGTVGGAHGHVVHVLHGADTLRARDHPSHGHGGRRQAHEQEPRQRR